MRETWTTNSWLWQKLDRNLEQMESALARMSHRSMDVFRVRLRFKTNEWMVQGPLGSLLSAPLSRWPGPVRR